MSLKRKNIEESILEMQKQHLKVLNEVHILYKKSNELDQKIKYLSNQNLQFELQEKDPILQCLAKIFIIPLIEICQSYNTSSICNICQLYHISGFCPTECLSQRKHLLKYQFTTTLRLCHNNGFRSRKFLSCEWKKFSDENDNAYFNWILKSIKNQFPEREYHITKHQHAQCVEHVNHNCMSMQILTMWTNDKIPRQKTIPPVIQLWCCHETSPHMVIESLPLKISKRIISGKNFP